MVKRVAVGADFPVDLEAALQLRLIERAEHAAETPLLARRLRLLRLLLRESEPAESKRRGRPRPGLRI